MQKKIYDAIVVGSGITGGYAAMELTKRGLDTLVLEAGRPISPERDYVEHLKPWQLRFRGLADRARQSRDQPIQRNCYACTEWSEKFF
ncbi:MAG: NAD(P)-binding protein, partial [Vicinamibacteria bacterium]